MTAIAQNLLSPADYTVSKATANKKSGVADKFIDNLKVQAPTFIDAEIDGYKILGKTAVFQQYVAQKDETTYKIQLRKIPGAGATGATASARVAEKDLSKMNIQTKRLRDVKFSDDLFVPMKSGTAIDYCYSTEGGVMPGTNYIVIGDPGIGKSTVTIEHAAAIQAINPEKRVLFISGEMTELDMIPYTKRFPKWLDIEILFVSDLTEGLYKESIEAKLQEGYDLVLGDSFAEIADAVRGDFNETVRGADKKSYNDVEKWLVDLMVHNNKANNDMEIYTSFIFIQQMTKGGDFVGSNKLKHNTTGMLELRYKKSGERQIIVSKNRRGFDYNNLHFSFGEGTDGVLYDTDRIMRDRRIEQEIKDAASAQRDEEQKAEKIWEKLGLNPDGSEIENPDEIEA
ncbi:MAG: hypothetical protein GY827_04690 [Cytophagales bacterium]|nr:hypothetical protein [Cytophagales bacterium]